MRDCVREKLESIFRYPMFANVGRPLPDSVTHVKGWRAALKTCSSTKWGNCRLMARNAVQRGVENQYPKAGMWERLQEWNSLAEKIGPPIDAFIDSLLPELPIPAEQRVNVKHCLQYDFFYTCLECELSDISAPVFFLKHLDPWYAAGHFPCGWDGKVFPEGWDGVIREGRLMVF